MSGGKRRGQHRPAVLALAREGRTEREIATRVGLPLAGVRRILLAAGRVRPTRGPRPRNLRLKGLTCCRR